MVPQVRCLKVFGQASGNVVLDLVLDTAYDHLTLLELLQEQRIPIASSCRGLGQCQKCVVTINHEKHLSCLIQIKNLGPSTTLEVSYL